MPNSENIKKNLSEQEKVQLGYRIRDLRYQKEYSALKIKIALNCFELFALFIVIAIGLYLLLSLTTWKTMDVPIIISIVLSLAITFIFYRIKKYQINITRFDKEDIYKKISKDLLNAKN